MFTPVRIDSMVLVDGGMTNNFPTNIAKEMGADIIIGVDVQSDLSGPEKLNTVPEIMRPDCKPEWTEQLRTKHRANQYLY